jgi:hypothetical protein
MDNQSVCQQCKTLFDYKPRAKYCSDSCKQSAYRTRVNPLSGTRASIKERAQLGARTKQRTETKLVCAQCGRDTYWSVAESTNRLYCGDACRQKSYRARKFL